MPQPPRPFDRPSERQELRFHLDHRRSILLLAPRRIGKTWLIKQVAGDLRGEWAAILCDVEGMTTEEQFLEHLCQQIQATSHLGAATMGRLRQLWANVFTGDLREGWQTLLRSDWKSFARTLVERLADQPHDTVILVDEIALFVLALQRRDAEAAHAFLYHLRALRQAYPRVRWVFTGSIGLDAVARRTDIAGALVDLHQMSLDPFDGVAAQAFLDHLSASGEILRPFRLDETGRAHLLTELGWLSPYYLEKLAHEVRPSGLTDATGRPLATIADLERAFERMLDSQHRTYFATWTEHLTKNFPTDEAAQLRAILDACAAQAEGEGLDTLLARLSGPPHHLSRRALRDRLSVLENDAYLVEEPGDEASRFRFRSGLLRRYWLKYEAE